MLVERQTIDLWFSGAGERKGTLGETVLMSMSFLFGMTEMFWNWIYMYKCLYFAGLSKYAVLRIFLQKVNWSYCFNTITTVQY